MKREVMQELIDKRQEQRADIYKIERQSETEFTINGHKYVLLTEYRDAFQTEKLEERFSSILSKYDYIVGDWGFDQLRLKGFFGPDNPLVQKTTSVDTIQDYLYEYCNFGCAYFVLHNLDVQKPTPVPKEDRRKNRVSSKQRKRKRQRQNNVYEEKVYEVHNRKPNRNSDKRNKMKAKTVGKNSRSRHFTIRQKD